MKTYAILATGQSMSASLAASLFGKCGLIAVSDAYRIAPFADALVSQDPAWWRVHSDAVDSFVGRKFGGPRVEIKGIERVEAQGLIASGTNSGLLAAHVAVKHFGATRVLLCGLDMAGSHFFGPHPAPLKNTTPTRFEVMREQFAAWKPQGIEIYNCSPGSALQCYPFKDLCDVLG
jgi:hypothetical protein